MKCPKCGNICTIETLPYEHHKSLSGLPFYSIKFISGCCGVDLALGTPKVSTEVRSDFECHGHVYKS